MIIPIYDETILPTISYPFGNTRKKPKRYLGNIAVTDTLTVDFMATAKSDTEIEALYDFWLNSCNNGLEPFLISLPIFGVASTAKDILVRFMGDFSANKENILWSSSIKLEVIGTIDYIIDGNGDFIVSDTGEYVVTDSGDYVPTGNVINSYREVLYGN